MISLFLIQSKRTQRAPLSFTSILLGGQAVNTYRRRGATSNSWLVESAFVVPLHNPGAALIYAAQVAHEYE